MEIESSAIWTDVGKIQKSGYKTGKYSSFSTWSMIIHTVKDDFYIYKVLNLDIEADYVNNITDIITVNFSIAINDYKNKLYPYVKNLEATLIKTYLVGVPNTTTPPTIVKQRFKMIFLPDSNTKLKGTVLDSANNTTAATLGYMNANCQLINRGIEPVRIKTFSGIIRGYKNDDIMKAVIPNELNKILVDGKPAVPKVDIAEIDNQQPNKHTIIPTGTSIFNIPTFLHEKMNGLYNSGVGTYLTAFDGANTFFVYPTHDVNRKADSKNTLTAFAIPENKLSFNDVSYNLVGKSLSVIGHTLDSFREDADAKFMDTGVGFNLTNAKPMMQKPVEMTPDGPVGASNKLNFNVATKDRADNFNYAPKVDTLSSNNPFTRYSAINKKSGNIVRFVWQAANDSLLYPAMPVTLYTVSEDKVVKYKGTLISVHTSYMFEGSGIKSTRYHCRCILSFYVETKS